MKFKDLKVGDIFTTVLSPTTYHIKTENLDNGWLQSNAITLYSDDNKIIRGVLCAIANDAEVEKIDFDKNTINYIKYNDDNDWK